MEDSDVPLPPIPAAPSSPTAGLLVDVGSQRPKQINRLKRGEGRIARQVQAALYNAREHLGIDAAAEIVPVVLLYRRAEPGYVLVAPEE